MSPPPPPRIGKKIGAIADWEGAPTDWPLVVSRWRFKPNESGSVP